MRKTPLALSALLLISIGLRAQYPDLSTYTDIYWNPIYFGMKCEVPPWIIGGGGTWRSYFLTNGIAGYVYSAQGSMLDLGNIPIQAGNAQTVGPDVNDMNSCALSVSHWKRNYYGIYSAQYLTDPVNGPVTIGFIHSEHKNVCYNNAMCSNLINLDHPGQYPTDCMNNLGSDDWPGYNGFLCAAWCPNNINTNWAQQLYPYDIGPIAWPSTGYLQQPYGSGYKATTGINTPSSIIYNGYVYVFYHDAGPDGSVIPTPPDVAGAREGIKVVRAPVSNALDPTAYQAFYEDYPGHETWAPSLPAGFTKELLLNFLYTPGPPTTDVMGDEPHNLHQEHRFSVAIEKNGQYFVGVESYYLTDPNAALPWRTAIRFSDDLLHWTARYDIEKVNDWTQSRFNYPILMSPDGWSNNWVDPQDIMVVGTLGGSGIANYVYVTELKDLAPPPPPPPPPPCPDPNVHCFPGINKSTSDSLQGNANAFQYAASGLYPNPSHGSFQLSYDLDHSTATKLTITDMTGRVIGAGAPISRFPGHYVQTIDLSSCTKGVYIVELVTDNGRKIFKVVLD